MRVLDTDVCIEMLRGNRKVVERRAATPDIIATTWITAAELYYGAAGSARPEANRARVATLLSALPVLKCRDAAAQMFGDAKALLRRRGRVPPDADLWIASLALSAGAVLVTGNDAHFRDVPGLTTEDWIRG